MLPKLYPHQKKQNKAVLKALKSHNYVIYGGATGMGKSICMAHIIKNQLDKGKKVLVLAPYRKLVFQLEETFVSMSPRVVMGAIDRGVGQSNLTISSIQTLGRRLKDGTVTFDNIDIILIDEMHLGGTIPPRPNSNLEILYNKYNNVAKFIGFSGTPIDAKGYRILGWNKTIYKYQTGDLIKMGFLANYDYYAPVDIDLSAMRTNSLGEYVNEDIEEVTNTPTAITSVHKIWKKNGKNKKKVLIFASSIHHAELLRKEIKGSFVIHSKISEKEQDIILEDFKNSKIGTLINVSMLLTGYDNPSIDMLIIARPIKAISTYIQCVGRSLRLYGDKRTEIYDMCSVYKTCQLPKDIRDFNRVKGEQKTKEDGDEVEELTMRCVLCDVVSPTNEYSITKKVKKTFILLKYKCPSCGEICREDRNDLTLIDEVNKVEETVVEKLSNKERIEIVGDLVEEHTSKMKTWSHFIVKSIVYTGRGELLDQAVAKGTTTKTLWKKIMLMYGDAKNEEA